MSHILIRTAIIQNTLACMAARILKREFTVYIAADKLLVK